MNYVCFLLFIKISIQEDSGLIPGLEQWVKDQALPRAVLWVRDAAWNWHCCAVVQASSCGSDWTPRLGSSIC